MAWNFLGWIAKISNPVLDPVFKPLLKLPPFWTMFIISFLITLITVLIYKKTTNQKLMKDLKMEMKEIQKEMKEFAHDTQKVMELQKK